MEGSAVAIARLHCCAFQEVQDAASGENGACAWAFDVEFALVSGIHAVNLMDLIGVGPVDQDANTMSWGLKA